MQPQHLKTDGNKMRTIRIKLYKFSELSKEAQFKALCSQINFEIELMDENSPFWEAAKEMERMKTPWFLAETLYHTKEYRDILISTIEANEYEFKEDGTIF